MEELMSLIDKNSDPPPPRDHTRMRRLLKEMDRSRGRLRATPEVVGDDVIMT